jgi:hypothetical protein
VKPGNRAGASQYEFSKWAHHVTTSKSVPSLETLVYCCLKLRHTHQPSRSSANSAKIYCRRLELLGGHCGLEAALLNSGLVPALPEPPLTCHRHTLQHVCAATHHLACLTPRSARLTTQLSLWLALRKRRRRANGNGDGVWWRVVTAMQPQVSHSRWRRRASRGTLTATSLCEGRATAACYDRRTTARGGGKREGLASSDERW